MALLTFTTGPTVSRSSGRLIDPDAMDAQFSHVPALCSRLQMGSFVPQSSQEDGSRSGASLAVVMKAHHPTRWVGGSDDEASVLLAEIQILGEGVGVDRIGRPFTFRRQAMAPVGRYRWR